MLLVADLFGGIDVNLNGHDNVSIARLVGHTQGSVAPVLSNSHQSFCDTIGAQEKHIWGDVMTVKNMVIELEVEYLQKAARDRGISRAKLVRLLMKKVIADELVPNILGDRSLADTEPPPQKYRRFRERKN
jgi:hypothetical protein